MIIIMLGAPASGKGSVAEILSKEFNIPAISSGDIFRKNISEGTELGKKANEYMTKGCLVPDDITVNMIAGRLTEKDVESGLILDGFPRTVKQAEELDKRFKKPNFSSLTGIPHNLVCQIFVDQVYTYKGGNTFFHHSNTI